MRTFKHLILFTLLLLVVGLVVGQWWVRSAAGISSMERRIKAATGLEAVVGSVRLNLNLSLTLTDVELILRDVADGDRTVLEVPAVTISGCGSRRRVRASRPLLTAVQTRRGDWVPAQARAFVDPDGLFEAVCALGRSLSLSLSIVDAGVVLQGMGGRETVSYSGIDWQLAPAALAGHPGLMHAVFSVQAINGDAVSVAWEWLSDANRLYLLSDEGTAAATVEARDHE